MPPRGAHPLANLCVGLLSTIQRNDAGIMNHFNQDHDVIPILHDLVVAVVTGVHHWRTGPPHDDATVIQLIVFGRVPTSAPQPGFFFTLCHDPLTFSSPGRDSSIRGIENE